MAEPRHFCCRASIILSRRALLARLCARRSARICLVMRGWSSTVIDSVRFLYAFVWPAPEAVRRAATPDDSRLHAGARCASIPRSGMDSLPAEGMIENLPSRVGQGLSVNATETLVAVAGAINMPCAHLGLISLLGIRNERRPPGRLMRQLSFPADGRAVAALACARRLQANVSSRLHEAGFSEGRCVKPERLPPGPGLIPLSEPGSARSYGHGRSTCWPAL